MAKIDIEFEWARGLEYELTPGRSPHIKQRGNGKQEFRPLPNVPDLYLRFERLDGTAQQFLQFAMQWGLLHTPARRGAEESVDVWKTEHRSMKEWVRLLDVAHKGKDSWVKTITTPDGQIRGFLDLASLKVRLVSGEPGDPRPKLVLQPQTLLDAMRLQLAQTAASGSGISACQQCGEWFEVGRAGKRSVAKFCKAECRNRFHYEARAK